MGCTGSKAACGSLQDPKPSAQDQQPQRKVAEVAERPAGEVAAGKESAKEKPETPESPGKSENESLGDLDPAAVPADDDEAQGEAEVRKQAAAAMNEEVKAEVKEGMEDPTAERADTAPRTVEELAAPNAPEASREKVPEKAPEVDKPVTVETLGKSAVAERKAEASRPPQLQAGSEIEVETKSSSETLGDVHGPVAETPTTGTKIVRVLQAGEAEVAGAIRKGDDKIARWLIPPTPTSVASEREHHFHSSRAYGDSDNWSVSSRKTAPIVVNSSTMGLDAFADWLLPGAQPGRSARTLRSNTSGSARKSQAKRRAERARSERRASHASSEEPVLTANFVLDDFKSIFASLRKLGNNIEGLADSSKTTKSFAPSGPSYSETAGSRNSSGSHSSEVSGASSNGRLKRGRVPSIADDDFQMRFLADEGRAGKSASSYSFRDMVSS